MRKLLFGLAVFAVTAGACASTSSTTTGAAASTTTGTTSPAVDECAIDNLNLRAPGMLTVGTDNPAFPPWIIGNKPDNGKGYEGALAYEVADRMGFDASQVKWVVVPFNSSYAPGSKDFDFDINNVTITPEREQAVTFSDPYYDLPQALIVQDGSPLDAATTVGELKDGLYGAQIGTTSLKFINTVLEPTQQARVYDTTVDAKSGLRNGDVDGLILDLPTADYEANTNTPNDFSLVGQFEPVDQLGLLFEKDNPLVSCVNEALAEIKDDGTLQDLQDRWLADFQAVPVIK